MSSERHDAAADMAEPNTLRNPGETLREAREARGLSIAEVALELKISRQAVEHIEAGRFDRLPGDTFTRGYIRSYARLMSAVYDATMAGHRAPARPRDVIGQSWQRMMARGMHERVADEHAEPVVEAGALETLRRSSGLLEVLGEISHGLESLVADGENILVVADAQGRVLWRSGSPSVRCESTRIKRPSRASVATDSEKVTSTRTLESPPGTQAVIRSRPRVVDLVEMLIRLFVIRR